MVAIFSSKDTVSEPAFITPWSLIHLTAGMASRSYMHFWTGQFSHAVYEIVGSKRVFNAVGFTVKKPSSLSNSFGDHLSFSTGQMIPISGPWTTVTVVLFVLFCVGRVEF